MSNTVIRVENLSKRYQLGTIGYGSLQHDLRAWWAKVRGKEDPNTKIGEKSRLDLHGEFWALRDVGFEVQRGDRVGIIGRNGAGKSTMLKLLSRVTSPTTGRIKVRGRIASLLEVGTGFHPELTGRENVFLNGAILGMKRREIQAKFDEIVGFAGVEQFIDTPVKRYSSGMYVRLAFSVAAHLDSEILIIDEVLAVGDAEFQKKCLGKMEDVSLGQGRTVLFVSHQMGAIKSLCNQAILLKNGMIEHSGGVEETLSRYFRTFGANQRNFSDLSLIRREQNLKPCLRSVAFDQPIGDEGLVLEMGLGITVVIQFVLPEGIGDANLVFGINLNTGERLATFTSFENLGVSALRCSEATVELRFPQLNLIPGEYFFSLALMAGASLVDKLDNLVRLQVVERDHFRTERFYKEGFGMMFLEPEVRILESRA